jgi:hypothetical protein
MRYQLHRMKVYHNVFLVFLLLFLRAFTPERERNDAGLSLHTEQQLRDLTQQFTEAEVSDNLSTFLKHYDTQTISMPEYQLTLENRDIP